MPRIDAMNSIFRLFNWLVTQWEQKMSQFLWCDQLMRELIGSNIETSLALDDTATLFFSLYSCSFFFVSVFLYTMCMMCCCCCCCCGCRRDVVRLYLSRVRAGWWMSNILDIWNRAFVVNWNRYMCCVLCCGCDRATAFVTHTHTTHSITGDVFREQRHEKKCCSWTNTPNW